MLWYSSFYLLWTCSPPFQFFLHTGVISDNIGKIDEWRGGEEQQQSNYLLLCLTSILSSFRFFTMSCLLLVYPFLHFWSFVFFCAVYCLDGCLSQFSAITSSVLLNLSFCHSPPILPSGFFCTPPSVFSCSLIFPSRSALAHLA